MLEPPGGEGPKGSSPLAAIKSRNYGNPYVGLCYILSASFTLVTFKGQTKKTKNGIGQHLYKTARQKSLQYL